MKLIVANKIKETEKAVDYCISFWIDSCDYYIYKWLPKKLVIPVDDRHIKVGDIGLKMIIDEIARKHTFNRASYTARFYPENIIWNKEDEADCRR